MCHRVHLFGWVGGWSFPSRGPQQRVAEGHSCDMYVRMGCPGGARSWLCFLSVWWIDGPLAAPDVAGMYSLPHLILVWVPCVMARHGVSMNWQRGWCGAVLCCAACMFAQQAVCVYTYLGGWVAAQLEARCGVDGKVIWCCPQRLLIHCKVPALKWCNSFTFVLTVGSVMPLSPVTL